MESIMVQVINSRSKNSVGPVARNILYGECCTFPKYGNNMVCMRLRTKQRDVTIVSNPGKSGRTARFLDLGTGLIYLVAHDEPALPTGVVVSIVDPVEKFEDADVRRLDNSRLNPNWQRGKRVFHPTRRKYGRVDGYYVGNDGQTPRFKVILDNGKRTDWYESSVRIN